MATFVSASHLADATTTTATIVLPSRSVTAGQFLVAAFAYRADIGAFQVDQCTDSLGGTTWVRVGKYACALSDFYTDVWWAVAATTGGMVVTGQNSLTLSVSRRTGMLAAWDGVPASVTQDVAQSKILTGTGGESSNAFTTTTADQLIIGLLPYLTVDFTATSPYTKDVWSSDIGMMERVVSSIQTAQTMAFTASLPGVYGALTTISFDITSASGPVITGPSGTPTGPTQATIACSTDTSGTDLYHLILPAATAAPADAAALIADGAAVAHTVAATGAQSYNITGLTTNTAVKVHFAQAGSNVSSSASFTPNTLASSGAPAAQTGTAGGGITWTGSTPQSFLTNVGNGSGAWSIVSSAGFSVAPSINTSTGVLSGGTLSGAGSYAPSVRYTDSSTVPAAQTLTFTLGLTVSGSGAATAVTLSGPSAGTVGVASTNFTAGANGTITGTVIVTPSDSGGGGTFTPSTVSISSGTPTATFTYTPASAGAKSITVTNSGSLSNPGALTYTASAAPGSFTATIGPFAMNTGSGARPSGTTCTYSLFNGAQIGGLVAATGVDGSGTLNATGRLVVAGLASAGPWECQVRFGDGGTARQQVTAA